MSAICLVVAGALRAMLPASEFTISWQHSVEKSVWEERYRIDGARLQAVEARIQSFGAGMEPPADARLVDGWWTWRPAGPSLDRLRLTYSPFTADYRVCWNGTCAPLAKLARTRQAGTVVEVSTCDKPRDRR